jgi:hypothetical protein
VIFFILFIRGNGRVDRVVLACRAVHVTTSLHLLAPVKPHLKRSTSMATGKRPRTTVLRICLLSTTNGILWIAWQSPSVVCEQAYLLTGGEGEGDKVEGRKRRKWFGRHAELRGNREMNYKSNKVIPCMTDLLSVDTNGTSRD